MMFMGRRVTNEKSTTRKVIAFVATTLLSLLLSAVILPVCSAASACSMPCCADTGDMAGHSVMPAATCNGSSGCSMRAFRTERDAAVLPADPPAADDEAIVSYTSLRKNPNGARSLRDKWRPLHRASARLYVINDVFLI